MAGAFTRPAKPTSATPHLYVANCGPAAGVPFDTVFKIFSLHGPLESVVPADGSGARVIVSFRSAESAAAARQALDGQPCAALQGRIMTVKFAVPVDVPAVVDHLQVRKAAEELEIPGLFLRTEFVTEKQEEALLAAVDAGQWQVLAKRRVQHYGYEFKYTIRNVDLSQRLGHLPEFVLPVVDRIGSLAELAETGEVCFPLDQLTVNEYVRGVGLSPHIDTHSAFEGAILSLSLAGPCVMEFRKYGKPESGSESGVSEHEKSPFERKALFLPPRSLVILSGEARYAWHHYIPHHKLDLVDGKAMERGPRRVSFTFRKVRHGACRCDFPLVCDTRLSEPPGPVKLP